MESAQVMIVASRFWGGAGCEPFAEAARAYIEKLEQFGWTHGEGWVETPSGDQRYECGCPNCRPDAYRFPTGNESIA